MSGRCCFEVVPLILQIPSRPRVLFLSGYLHPRYVRRALQSGAHGYALKADLKRIDGAILQVHRGETYFSPAVRRVAAGLCLRGFDRTTTGPVLSSGERKVLQGAAAGRSHGQVAATLGLSRNTVRKYWEAALGKLDLVAMPLGMLRAR